MEVTEELFNEEFVQMAKEKSIEFIKLMSYYRCAIMELETKFNVLNEYFSLQYDRQPITDIKTRLKSPVSIREKLKRRNLPMALDVIEKNLFDIAGIRVVCSFPDDVYMIEEALLKQDDVVLIERKDYIANPKPNGYRSLHLIVEIPIFLATEKRMMKAEIQLRTIAMDFWATLEHQLRYKKNNEFTEEMAIELDKCAEISANLDKRMEELRRKCLGS